MATRLSALCRQLRLKCKGIHAVQPIYMRLARLVLKSVGYPTPSRALFSPAVLFSSLLLSFFRHPSPIIRVRALLYIRSIRIFVEMCDSIDASPRRLTDL